MPANLYNYIVCTYIHEASMILHFHSSQLKLVFLVDRHACIVPHKAVVVFVGEVTCGSGARLSLSTNEGGDGSGRGIGVKNVPQIGQLKAQCENPPGGPKVPRGSDWPGLGKEMFLRSQIHAPSTDRAPETINNICSSIPPSPTLPPSLPHHRHRHVQKPRTSSLLLSNVQTPLTPGQCSEHPTLISPG